MAESAGAGAALADAGAVGVCRSAAADRRSVGPRDPRSVGALICILVKYLVYRSQQLSRLIQRHLTLNPEIRLKICHQKRGGYSFAGNVANYKPETPSAKVQEIEVIAANLASLDARTRVFECSDRR